MAPQTLWNIEGHKNTRLPSSSSEQYRPSFWQMLVEVLMCINEIEYH
jgi:hypothetical protein